ncbi:MAG: hypothetical protein AAF744_03770 [Pseudomonadota bacterium]
MRTAARALIAVPRAERAALCARMIEEAHWADKFARRLRKAHRDWGNGTLLEAARRHPLAPERGFECAEWRGAFMLLLEQLSARGGRGRL